MRLLFFLSVLLCLFRPDTIASGWSFPHHGEVQVSILIRHLCGFRNYMDLTPSFFFPLQVVCLRCRADLLADESGRLRSGVRVRGQGFSPSDRCGCFHRDSGSGIDVTSINWRADRLSSVRVRVACMAWHGPVYSVSGLLALGLPQIFAPSRAKICTSPYLRASCARRPVALLFSSVLFRLFSSVLFFLFSSVVFFFFSSVLFCCS